MLETGTKAPELRLPNLDGDAVDLGDGTPTLVVFVEEDCPTSRMALGRLDALVPAFARAGARIVAVHQNDTETAARTMRRTHARYEALVESEPYATSSAFDVATVPTAYLIDGDGNVGASIEGWCTADFNDVAEQLAEGAGSEPGRVTDEPPLIKPGCASKSALDPSLWNAGGDGADYDEVEDLFERGWTDGLPVVPPTRSRVDAMLGGRDPQHSLGPVPPGMGELTLERLASCAVLAGCHPTYFPVVMAAAEALLDSEFNLHGMTNTTHTAGIVLIVNGPVRAKIGMNSGINCMGGWNRANATIGRAVRLMSGLTGEGRPPKLDRSAMGQPGKISFCFAENEEASPWEPYSVTRGFEPGTSTVTAYCGDSPFTVSDHYSRDVEDVLASIALAGAAVFSPNVMPMAAETVFVICQEHARGFEKAGWSRDDVAQRIFKAAEKRVGDITVGERSPFLAMMKPDDVVSKWSDPSEIHLVVSGGPAGRFSSIIPPWVGFGLGSTIVTKAVNES